MIVKIGSIVKLTYKGNWGALGWQTGIIGDPRGPWMPVTYLTPIVSETTVWDDNLKVGGTKPWYMSTCLEYFDLEVLEEGAGKDLELWTMVVLL